MLLELGDEEGEAVMINKFYLKINLLVSILFGIILPLILGVKDPTLIAICFTLIWFVYTALFFAHTFLIKGRRLKKELEAKPKSDSYPHH